VADVRAPTPSAAAEIVMAAAMEHLQYLQQAGKRLNQTMLHLLAAYSPPFGNSPKAADLDISFCNPRSSGPAFRRFSEEMTLTMQRMVTTKRLQLGGLQRQLQALDPMVRVQHLKQKAHSAHLSFEIDRP
jgi:exodeoxyribonuclease VII large subunit